MTYDVAVLSLLACLLCVNLGRLYPKDSWTRSTLMFGAGCAITPIARGFLLLVANLF